MNDTLQASRPVQGLIALLQFVIATMLLVIVAGLVAGTAPLFLNYESFIVYSGSMEPSVSVGSLTVVAPSTPSSLQVGDIIVYRTLENPGVVVTHRLVDVTRDADGALNFQTKGDANETVDRVLVNEQSVLGHVLYSIPKLGYLADFAKQPLGLMLLIGLPGLLLGLDAMVASRRRRGAGGTVDADVTGVLHAGQLAFHSGQLAEALSYFDRAIALDPRLEEAWLLKASHLPTEQERRACLAAALVVNPASVRLRSELHGPTRG